ncbi:MAG: S24 family peptidase [Bryobacterales bacterium]
METPLGIQELLARLIRHLTERVRRGEMSERSLARLTRYSQPHIHNVLKGSRTMTAEMADRILHLLGVPLLALLTQEELSGVSPPPAVEFPAAPVMEGRLGGGKAFPKPGRDASRYFLPAPLLASAVSPVVVQLDDREAAMSPFLEPGDWVLLDRSPAARRRPHFEYAYALSWNGEGFVRRCRVVRGALVVVPDNPSQGGRIPTQIALAGQEILDLVQGRIVWIGRELKR